MALIATALILSVTAFCIGRYAAKRFHGDLIWVPVLYSLIFEVVAVLGPLRWGCSINAVKYMVYFLIAQYCSYSDLKTKMVDNCPHLMIAITAFIGVQVNELPEMFVTAFFFGVVMMAAILCRAQIGGADLKFITASAFLLGRDKTMIGLLIGLSLAVMVNLIKRKNNQEAFPLVPYLSAGFTAALFI